MQEATGAAHTLGCQRTTFFYKLHVSLNGRDPDQTPATFSAPRAFSPGRCLGPGTFLVEREKFPLGPEAFETRWGLGLWAVSAFLDAVTVSTLPASMSVM